MLVHVLSMLFLTLGLVGLVVVGLGLARTLDVGNAVRVPAYALGLVALLLGLAAAFLWPPPGGRRKAIVLAIAGAAFAAGAFALKTESLGDPHGSQWVIFASLILIAASLHWAVLVAARKRFLFSARWASVWGASIAIAVVVGAITQYRSLARPGLQAMAANKFDLWVQSALFGVELVLAGAKYAWVVVVAFLKVQPNKNRDLRA